VEHDIKSSIVLNNEFEACTSAGSLRGEKSAFIAHILGCNGKLCIYTLVDAIFIATSLKYPGTTTALTASSLSTAVSASKHSRSASTFDQSHSIPKKLKQGSLAGHAYGGTDMPFSSNETAAVQAQVLRAVISANLPF
jgi:hypothetical protein